MSEAVRTIAGLRTIVLSPDLPGRQIVVFLHGYGMGPEQLAPFASSPGKPAHFFIPAGPLPAIPSGQAWWDMDPAARAYALADSPRDMSAEHPIGAPAARACLCAFLEAVREEMGTLPLILVGFSQGGMLACDLVLRSQINVAGLALLSSSRVSADEWELVERRVRGLPVFISHGRADSDLSFSAGEALRDLFLGRCAQVTWVPFDQGHEIPMLVWRHLWRFLASIR